MNDQKPRLILIEGSIYLTTSQMQHLKSAFDVVEVENIVAARALAGSDPGAIIAPNLLGGDQGLSEHESEPPQQVLEYIAEGAGTVDLDGRITWANQRLLKYSNQLQREFAKRCLDAIDFFNKLDVTRAHIDQHLCKRLAFQANGEHYEVIASPSMTDPEEPSRTLRVVGVLWNTTATRTLQAKIDAIDAAGSELMRIEPSSISSLNMAERLSLLEEKIVRYVKEILDFDNFEIRLLNRETNQLELVITRGIAPLKVGEVMFAELTGHGISGHVASTGESYLCPDVRRDPLYREGLDNARSSLTVPLRLYDRVIGVFNVESFTTNIFNADDRQFAEIFGRYVASAMNILDLLVVERYTTNEELTQNMLGELNKPLGEITSQAEALLEAQNEDEREKHLKKIVRAASGMRNRIEACTSGPRTILGAEEEMRRLERDPNMVNKRVLVADDERSIREPLASLLRQKGCRVTTCGDGTKTVATLRRTKDSGRRFDLVISDIKLPGCNGFEIFHTAKEIDPDVPVILMTGFGYDPNHSIVRASQKGLHSFLFKPFKASQLLELVEKAFLPADVE
ncbi:MAG: response regulator [Planctomycetota bacterium]|nr:response regulator [Planctomycetota bacterium]